MLRASYSRRIYSMRYLGWNAVHTVCSLHAIMEGFIQNKGYNVSFEKHLIVAGFSGGTDTAISNVS